MSNDTKEKIKEFLWACLIGAMIPVGAIAMAELSKVIL